MRQMLPSTGTHRTAVKAAEELPVCSGSLDHPCPPAPPWTKPAASPRVTHLTSCSCLRSLVFLLVPSWKAICNAGKARQGSKSASKTFPEGLKSKAHFLWRDSDFSLVICRKERRWDDWQDYNWPFHCYVFSFSFVSAVVSLLCSTSPHEMEGIMLTHYDIMC